MIAGGVELNADSVTGNINVEKYSGIRVLFLYSSGRGSTGI